MRDESGSQVRAGQFPPVAGVVAQISEVEPMLGGKRASNRTTLVADQVVPINAAIKETSISRIH